MPELKRAVHSHVPFDAAEHADKIQILELIDTPGYPFDRKCFEPGHLTGSLFMVTPDHSMVVMIFHKKFDRWLQPGGHINPDDVDLLGTALRETEEETGVDATTLQPRLFDLDIHTIPPFGDELEHKHFDIRFIATTDHVELSPGADVADARWMSLHHWDGVTSDTGLRRVVKKLRTLHG